MSHLPISLSTLSIGEKQFASSLCCTYTPSGCRFRKKNKRKKRRKARRQLFFFFFLSFFFFFNSCYFPVHDGWIDRIDQIHGRREWTKERRESILPSSSSSLLSFHLVFSHNKEKKVMKERSLFLLSSFFFLILSLLLLLLLYSEMTQAWSGQAFLLLFISKIATLLYKLYTHA